MEGALRLGLEQSLLASAGTVAAAIAEQNAPLCSPPQCIAERVGTTIYAPPLAVEPELDGARDDAWNGIADSVLAIDGEHRLLAGTYGRFAYVHLTVADRDLVYQRGPHQTPYGDRVVFGAEPSAGAARWWLLNT